MFTREDWQVGVEKRRAGQVKEEQRSLKQMALAVPPMESLMADERWNIFVKVLQGQIEAREKELIGLRGGLTDGEFTNADNMISQRLKISRLVGQVEALTAMREIPKQLAQEGKKAANLLRKYEVD